MTATSATPGPEPLFRPDGRDLDRIRAEFRWCIPPRFNMGVSVCDRHAVATPDALALICENASGTVRRVTFGELKSLSDRFANALAGLGVGRGDRVGIVLPQRLETVVAHIATYKLGAVTLPLSNLFGSDALAFRLADSGARVVITDRSRLELAQALRADIDTLEAVVCCDPEPGALRFDELLTRASASFTAVDTAADDPAFLIYTSGTTGPPKGALGAHRCLLGNLTGFELSQDFFPRDGDLMWTPADWAWTGGLLDALLPALHYRVPVLGHDGGRFDPERALALIGRHRVRNGFIPPTALKLLRQVEAPRERHGLALRSIMSAGEQLGAEVLRWCDEALGVRVNEMWGQTEANYLAGSSSTVLETRPGSMGKPYPGHHVDVIDEDGQPMPAGQVGELAARRGDPVMFLGYWRNEAATAEKVRGDWWLTGDLGYRDDDGYLWFMGRKDDVISSAGHRIGPGEVEDALLKHPAVAQAAAVGSPDPLRGEIVKAFVVLARGHAPSDALVAAIQADVKARLAAHEYPREIEFVESLPMTTTGKVRRIELRQLEIARKRGG